MPVTEEIPESVEDRLANFQIQLNFLSRKISAIETPVRNESKNVISEIFTERKRQDQKWGGASHDDNHSTFEFVQWIKAYADWARMMFSMKSYNKTRKRLIQVAALAVAAIESLDRKYEKK